MDLCRRHSLLCPRVNVALEVYILFLTRLSSGDEVYRAHTSIFVQFSDNRKVLSTSHLNGGYREDLEAVFNFDSKPDDGKEYCMRSDTYEEELKIVARELGLNPEKTTGISTVVSMENVSIKTNTYKELTVTAIVTAGIAVNAGRVGDPASFYEKEGQVVMLQPGTINIILSINADMLPGTLARALVTCTEAKTAAVEELMARSMFSRGLATGSGTDETIVICNSDSKHKLSFAGKHSKLGELIGITVIEAVKEALYLHTGLSPEGQHSVFRRLDRFGIDEEKVWEKYSNLRKQPLEKDEFMKRLAILERSSDLVTLSSLYAHLIDQLDWRLLGTEEVAKEATAILNAIGHRYNLTSNYHINDNSISLEETIFSMAENFMLLLVEILDTGETRSDGSLVSTRRK